MLYRVTKIKYRRDYDWKTSTYTDNFREISRRVDYRTRKCDVTAAMNYAKKYSDKYYKYEVVAEIAVMPTFYNLNDVESKDGVMVIKL